MYYFRLKKEIAKNIFAEYCEVHGNYYGTSKDKVNDMINRGKVTYFNLTKIAILEIDLQGG
jgi:guanylate kinase